MKTGEKLSLCLLLLIVFAGSVAAQELITNVYGRNECYHRPVRPGATDENL